MYVHVVVRLKMLFSPRHVDFVVKRVLPRVARSIHVVRCATPPAGQPMAFSSAITEDLRPIVGHTDPLKNTFWS